MRFTPDETLAPKPKSNLGGRVVRLATIGVILEAVLEASRLLIEGMGRRRTRSWSHQAAQPADVAGGAGRIRGA